MVFVKICGITEEKSLQTSIDCGANALGFVVNTPDSLRNLTERRALDLIHLVPPKIQTVVVTRAYALNEVEYLATRFPKSKIQVHLRSRLPRLEDLCTLNLDRVIPALTALQVVKLNLNYPSLQKIFSQIQYVLLDGSEGKGRLEQLDTAVKAVNLLRPCKVLLAGGLNPNNLLNVLQNVPSFGIDVSSGVERTPGVKDPQQIKAFFKIARVFENNPQSFENYSKKYETIQNKA